MRIANWILAVIFLLFAIVQYNDPDPIHWMVAYTFVAVMLGLAATKRYYRWVTLGGLAIFVIWMVFIIPDFINWLKMGEPSIVATMKAETPYVELTREFLGVVLCILALGFVAWQGARKRRPTV